LFLAFLPVVAQELPPIQNFTPVDYGAENQNWSITQSSNKNIYTANDGGVLEYNGAVWMLYGAPIGSSDRLISVMNDMVYSVVTWIIVIGKRTL
jgi:hypothetical protein